jgi:hypothetical protein
MASTTNYSWSTPDNSGLVKNGAQDIRTLGSAVDTSLWNVGFGQAGKNKIINGDFRINQRNFTSSTTSAVFGFDRFFMDYVDGTSTYSAQTFTPGTAPVAGYEAINFSRLVTTGQTLASAYTWYRHRIEDVRTLAGQTTTVSFWAKAASGTPKIAVELAQAFGVGGSAQVTNYLGQATLSTSWQRFSVTGTLPSLSGKTIGTSSSLTLNLYLSAGSDYNARSGSLGIQSNTFDIWGVQVEAGSVATAFQTATATIQGELAAAQRYYQRITPTASGQNYGVGFIGGGLGDANLLMEFPVEMRTRPTALEQSGTATDYTITNSSGTTVCNAVPTFSSSTTYALRVNFATAGIFTANSCALGRAANANAYLGWSAELG